MDWHSLANELAKSTDQRDCSGKSLSCEKNDRAANIQPHFVQFDRSQHTYLMGDETQKAIELLETNLPLMKSKLTEQNTDVLMAMESLASAYFQDGRPDDAIDLLTRTVTIQRSHLGSDNRHTQRAVADLGYYLRKNRQLNDAIPLLREATRSSLKYPIHSWAACELLRAYGSGGHDD